jgi:hypothetical protein
MRDILVGLLCGLIFGTGLLVSGMMQPSKVLAFLDLFGAWDPSLAVVMAVALAGGQCWLRRAGGPRRAPSTARLSSDRSCLAWAGGWSDCVRVPRSRIWQRARSGWLCLFWRWLRECCCSACCNNATTQNHLCLRPLRMAKTSRIAAEQHNFSLDCGHKKPYCGVGSERAPTPSHPSSRTPQTPPRSPTRRGLILGNQMCEGLRGTAPALAAFYRDAG